MKLRRNERCPIHPNNWNCVCRQKQARVVVHRQSKWENVSPGVRRIKDDSLAAGYRYRLSPGIKREVLLRKIRDQQGICALFGVIKECKEAFPDGKFTDLSNVALDHIEPRGMNGSNYDDGRLGENLQAVHHFPCNVSKGSRRLS